MLTADQILNQLAPPAPPPERPQVTLSYAQSLDGSIAREQGKPEQLSGSETAVLTHALRAAHDGILIGVGALLADNSRLTVRLVEGPNPQPVVLDPHLKTPLTAALFRHPDKPPWIVTGENPDQRKLADLEAQGARIFRLPTGLNGWIDLPTLLRSLYSLGVHDLMVEGGARVLTSFLCACLADRLVVTIAPRFLRGYPVFSPSPGEARSCLPHLDPSFSEMVGRDVVVWGRLKYDEREGAYLHLD